MSSYENILEKMTNTYFELSGWKPDDASDIGMRLKVLAAQVSKLNQDIQNVEQQIFPQTSSGNYLDLHAQMRGLRRKTGTVATGTLRFSRSAAAPINITIPRGTLVASGSEDLIYFRTSHQKTLKAGSTYIDVPGEALESGGQNNMKIGQINILVDPVAGITKVGNITEFIGGGRTETDTALRNRIVNSYASISTGSNVAYYRDLANAQQGVSSVKVLPRYRGRGTVDVVLSVEKDAQQEDIVGNLSSMLEEQREIGVDALVYPAKEIPADLNIKISIQPDYTSSVVLEETQSKIENYIRNLDISEPLRLNHLGKNILLVPGILDYSFESPSKNIAVLEYQKIMPGNIIVSIGGA